jgi:hypothetical protein
MRFGSVIYIELRHDGFSARNLLGSNVVVDTADDPERFPPADVAAAFGHERVILADFIKAEHLLDHMIRPLCPRDFVKPVLIVRVQHRFAQSATPVELRALIDVAEWSGARRVGLWFGRALSDEEILHQQFPADGIVIRDDDFARPKQKNK